MKLKQYKYGKTRIALDISEIVYVSVLSDRAIEILFRNRYEKSILFESRENRDQFYEDILRDIEEINKPIVCTESYTTYMANNLRDSLMTKPTALTENPYLYTDPDLRMKCKEDE